MASTTSTNRSSTPRDITGIALSVDRYDDEPPQVLTFYKNKTEAILIGRRSSMSTKAQADETDRALFRCPVISRRHAKIMFTQFGNVYLSDLTSHHGTHILRAGEKASTMIKPDIPSVLADGDTITFGKAVGREDSLVRPIIAKVRLLFGAPPPSSESASSSAPATPAAPTAAVHTSSGRYGIYTPAMTSSSSDSSESEEVEEIPPPPPALRPCGSFFTFGSRASHSHQMHHVFHTRHAHHTQVVPNPPGRLGLLRRILPRVGSIEEIAAGHGSSRLSPISVSSVSRSPSVVEVRREDMRPSSPAQVPEVVDSFLEPALEFRAQSPGEDMDLESDAPSEYPSKPVSSGDMEIIQEASFDGPLPVLVASSRICTPEPEFEFEFDSTQPQRQVEDDSSDSDLYTTPAPELIPEPVQEVPQAPMGHPAIASQLSNFRSSPEYIGRNFWSSPDYSSRSASPASAAEPFDTRVENLKMKLADLEQRMLASSKASSAEPEQAEQSAQAPEVAAPAPDVDVAPMVDSLKEMLQSLDELRKKAEADMAKELDAIRALRAEAEAATAAALARATVVACPSNDEKEKTPPASPSHGLKRKRDALEDSDADDEAVSPAPACQALFDKLAAEPPRKRSRGAVARRIAVGVAKTTAIAAVGAVATWSALAFS